LHLQLTTIYSKEITMITQIDCDTLARKLAGSARPVLVEALPEKYFRDWHLPGARHLPHDEVARLAPKVLPDKAAEIVVYCASRSCQNSHAAAAKLAQMGYENVAVYAGGKQDWSEAGLPVERGEALAA
jgi:rhodanese-related sulfurtransferase